MHQLRRRDRHPARRVAPKPVEGQASPVDVAGANVMIVGYFSAKEKNFVALMDSAATVLTSRGARVVGQIVQRRGVSDGGVEKMGLPYSARTLLSYGKIREVAAACEGADADVVVFVCPLTERQQRVLTGMFGCPAVSLAATFSR